MALALMSQKCGPAAVGMPGQEASARSLSPVNTSEASALGLFAVRHSFSGSKTFHG